MDAKAYKIDRLAEECGHTVLRLPPYHRDLNPIELLWAKVKHDVAMNNANYTLNAVENLLNEALDNVSLDYWKKCIAHVKKGEDIMWDLDGISDELQDRIIETDAVNDEDSEEEDFFSDKSEENEDSDSELAVPL